MTIITVLGLGAMGLPMATNLAQQFTVRGYDPAPERTRLAIQQGIETFATVRESATGADVVLLAVRNQAQLSDALFGNDGVVDALRPGAAIILTSTVGIEAVAAVVKPLADAGIELIDAPISGGPARAGTGDLLVVVGAPQQAYQQVLPVLEAMSSTLVWVGDTAGKGQAMKTVNQLLCGVHIAAAGEALALAQALGLDVEQALEALMAGAAASFMLGDRGPRALQAYDEGGAEVKSRLDIFVKDMGIVTSAAKQCGMAVPVAAAAEQEYLLGLANGQGAQDDSSIIKVVAPTQPKAAHR